MIKYCSTHLQIKSHKWKITVMVHKPWRLKGYMVNKDIKFNKDVSERTMSKTKVPNKKNWWQCLGGSS